LRTEEGKLAQRKLVEETWAEMKRVDFTVSDVISTFDDVV
jgi:hypothetical protein